MHAKLFQPRLTLRGPMRGSPPGSSVRGDSPGKNTAVGCCALLQGISPTQGSNLRLLWLLHCRGFFTTEPLEMPKATIPLPLKNHELITFLNSCF